MEAIYEKVLNIIENHDKVAGKQLVQELLPQQYLELFAPLRSNVIRWMDIAENTDILEINSGGGGVTEYLAEVAGHVTCVEESELLCRINAWRNQSPKVSILNGNVADRLNELQTQQYDMIIVWGQLDIIPEQTVEQTLRQLLSMLRIGGRLILGIDNKYGLKYWAGVKEDHQKEYFTTLTGEGEVRYGKNQLDRLLKKLQRPYQYYYPYPDYRYAAVLYSEDYLPRKGELVMDTYPHSQERMCLFAEHKVYDNLIADGLYTQFANSYLIVVEGA